MELLWPRRLQHLQRWRQWRRRHLLVRLLLQLMWLCRQQLLLWPQMAALTPAVLPQLPPLAPAL